MLKVPWKTCSMNRVNHALELFPSSRSAAKVKFRDSINQDSSRKWSHSENLSEEISCSDNPLHCNGRSIEITNQDVDAFRS